MNFSVPGSVLQRFVYALTSIQIPGKKSLLPFCKSLLIIACSGFFGLIFSTATAQNFRASASAGAITGTLTLTINKPTGTVTGDVMIASLSVGPATVVYYSTYRLDACKEN